MLDLKSKDTSARDVIAASVRCEALRLPVYGCSIRSVYPPLMDPDNVYPFSMYPYTGFLENKPQPTITELNSVVIENGLLRVTVLPDLGGRIMQIEDLRTGGLYLHENRVVRPCRIPPRWNFISLGIEFNFPFTHSPTGNEPVGYELISDRKSGMAGAAVGMTDLQWGLSWRAEIRLYPDFRGVVVVARCWNDTSISRSVQWWSNAAQPGGGDAEFVFPNEPVVAHIDGEGNGHWPYFNNIDLRWHRRYDQMAGTFHEPTKADWFGIYHHERKWGLLHLADPLKLPGKKIWSFGYTGATAEWSLSMTRDGGRSIEIQAGLPTIQTERYELSPGKEFEFEEMWIPVDSRDELDDAWRPSFSDCVKRLGGISAAAKKVPHGAPRTIWHELADAYRRRDESFLRTNLESIECDWPITGIELEAALEWAAERGEAPWKTALGNLYFAKEDWANAMRAFDAALSAAPKNAMANSGKALILWKVKHQRESAWKHLAAAIEVLPDGAMFVHANTILREMGNLKERRELLRRWTNENDFRRMETIAELLLDEGNPNECLKVLRETVWPRHHCRHRRTKLWHAAFRAIGIPVQPVPVDLREDPYVVPA